MLLFTCSVQRIDSLLDFQQIPDWPRVCTVLGNLQDFLAARGNQFLYRRVDFLNVLC